MKKILLTLILTTGCSSAFAHLSTTYVFKCLNTPEINFFEARDDNEAIQRVTRALSFQVTTAGITYYTKGCGSRDNVQFLSPTYGHHLHRLL